MPGFSIAHLSPSIALLSLHRSEALANALSVRVRVAHRHIHPTVPHDFLDGNDVDAFVRHTRRSSVTQVMAAKVFDVATLERWLEPGLLPVFAVVNPVGDVDARRIEDILKALASRSRHHRFASRVKLR